LTNTAEPPPGKAATVHFVDFKWEGRPIRLQFGDADDHIAKIIRNTGTFYEIELLRDVRARLFFAKCAVDVGAHVGNHTLFLAHVLGLRTVAFEPNPATFRHLEANVIANSPVGRCRLHKLAVGQERGRARLRMERAAQNSGLVGIELAGRGDVEVVSLDEALRDEPQVDIVKIDVEGFEEHHFARVCHILAEARYVCWMRFNFTPTFLFMPEERLHPRKAAV
jgi:FkbM family methyltransferase